MISEYSSPEDADSGKYSIMFLNRECSYLKATYHTLLFLQKTYDRHIMLDIIMDNSLNVGILKCTNTMNSYQQ